MALTHGEIQRLERGGTTEMRFFSAFQQSGRAPKWFVRMRRATRDEDLNGVDAIAELDVCEVQIQIKSSQAGLEKHRKNMRTDTS